MPARLQNRNNLRQQLPPKTYLHSFDTFIGPVALAWGDHGVVALQLPYGSAKLTEKRLAERLTEGFPASTKLSIQAPGRDALQWQEQITEHLGGRLQALHKIPLAGLTKGPKPAAFSARVYQELQQVPAGQVVTYSELARKAGAPEGARAVGRAMAQNPLPLLIPCHRVVGSGGQLVGFTALGGLALKQKLLQIEKAHFSISPWPALASQKLAESDPQMARVIAHVGPCNFTPTGERSPFASLFRAIVFQQLNGRAAQAILTRVLELFGGSMPTPQALLATRSSQLRERGLSANKILALKDLAQKSCLGVVPTKFSQLTSLSDEEIISRLTQVRGIGPWTVQMMLIFALARPDVMPADDFGVRKGFAQAFGQELGPKELRQYSARWAPYRSLASWYLWRLLDLPPLNEIGS